MFMTDVYIKSFGKYIKIIYLANSEKSANHFMETNPDCGVLKEEKGYIFIADNANLGVTENE